ncbi:MAG: hypothetical protein PHF05_06415 [Candidatus Izemoplasmatales bacterium]|nr:hypothetical protein [Candidatus Izemoplasmatales bacterium]
MENNNFIEKESWEDEFEKFWEYEYERNNLEIFQNMVANFIAHKLSQQKKEIIEMIKTTKYPYMVKQTEERFINDLNKL